MDNGDSFYAKSKTRLTRRDQIYRLNQHDQHKFSSNYTTNLVTYRNFVDAVNIEFFEKDSRASRDLVRIRRYYRWLPCGTIP